MSNKQKESFKFEYTRPLSDWYEIIKVEIKPDDFYYFRLERRFGPSWWLIGTNPKDNPKYHWEDSEIGEIELRDLKRFIEWAKTDHGSKLIEVKAISGAFDILKEIRKLIS